MSENNVTNMHKGQEKESHQGEMTIKIFLLGDTKVGKTACIQRYCCSQFFDRNITTMGCDKMTKKVPLENGKIASVQIWDTAGQERYRAITRNMFKSADGIFLVYSVIEKDTFINVSNWMKDIKSQARKNIPIILCGNKIDLTAQRVVETAEGEKLAEKFGVKLFETSCKEDINIKEAFKALVKEISLIKKEKSTGGQSINFQPKKKCCS